MQAPSPPPKVKEKRKKWGRKNSCTKMVVLKTHKLLQDLFEQGLAPKKKRNMDLILVGRSAIENPILPILSIILMAMECCLAKGVRNKGTRWTRGTFNGTRMDCVLAQIVLVWGLVCKVID